MREERFINYFKDAVHGFIFKKLTFEIFLIDFRDGVGGGGERESYLFVPLIYAFIG